MEAHSVHHVPEEEEEEEEYVLLDLDAVSGQLDIPPNAPYVLSGLDTLNPVLVIDNKLKLGESFQQMLLYTKNKYKEIGDYEETIGTCLIFTEEDTGPVVHEETGPSDANLFSGKCIIDPNKAPKKQVKPVTRLHKILRFRLCHDADTQDSISD